MWIHSPTVTSPLWGFSVKSPVRSCLVSGGCPSEKSQSREPHLSQRQTMPDSKECLKSENQNMLKPSHHQLGAEHHAFTVKWEIGSKLIKMCWVTRNLKHKNSSTLFFTFFLKQVMILQNTLPPVFFSFYYFQSHFKVTYLDAWHLN